MGAAAADRSQQPSSPIAASKSEGERESEDRTENGEKREVEAGATLYILFTRFEREAGEAREAHEKHEKPLLVESSSSDLDRTFEDPTFQKK